MSKATLPRDIVSAYAVTGARVAAWATISAFVFRKLGPESFAMLALIRSTVGLLAYTSIGLAPAMVRALAETREQPSRWQAVYASGQRLAWLSAVVAALLCVAYGFNVSHIHQVPSQLGREVTLLATAFGLGMVYRLMSEAPASLLQVSGRIALDNLFLLISEGVWVVVSVVLLLAAHGRLPTVGTAFLAASFLLFLLRAMSARWLERQRRPESQRASGNWSDIRRLLTFGVAVAIAQAADFLYAPTDYILINRLIGPSVIAVYAPAVQIDSGLLLIVTAMAGVLLPHSALAHAAGDRGGVRRFYLRGTLASIALLIPAACVVLLLAPRLLHAWLGSDMPQTVSILPIMLLNTVVGGSNAVGRSILLGMGKVRAFAVSVVLAGVINVIVSFCIVRFGGMGLKGIILGTIVAVVGRCLIWMPWYVLRTLRPAKPDNSASRA